MITIITVYPCQRIYSVQHLLGTRSHTDHITHYISVQLSLVPRLLLNFLIAYYTKTGESQEEFLTCMMMHYVWFYAWFW